MARTLPVHRGGIGGFPKSAFCLVDPAGNVNPTIHAQTEPECWAVAETRMKRPRKRLEDAGYTVERTDMPDAPPQ